MRILRLGNSNDVSPLIGDEAKTHSLVERMLQAETGEPVETVIRVIWPDPELPDIVDRWVVRYEPDIVFLRVNSFWYSFESVPLRLRRLAGPLGGSLYTAGRKAADTPWLAYNEPFRKVRRFAQRTIGGDTHFPPELVVQRMEECIRRILRHEHVGLIVRGTDGGTHAPEETAAEKARHDRRRAIVHEGLKAVCDELHVTYLARDTRRPLEQLIGVKGRDGTHGNEKYHEVKAADEGPAILAVWRSLHAAIEPPPPRNA